MPKLPRTRESREEILRTHHRLLVELGKSFDSGVHAMALPLALSIRTLVHDRGKSTSLLNQLGVKTELGFIDTAVRVDPENLRPTFGLVIAAHIPSAGFRWEAPLNNLSPRRRHPPLSFDEWWTTRVANDTSGNGWSREDLVRNLANKEGAAHVDPLREEDLRRFHEANAMGLTFVDDLLGEHTPTGGPYLPSIRQIAHELQRTLEAGLGPLLNEPGQP